MFGLMFKFAASLVLTALVLLFINSLGLIDWPFVSVMAAQVVEYRSILDTIDWIFPVSDFMNIIRLVVGIEITLLAWSVLSSIAMGEHAPKP